MNKTIKFCILTAVFAIAMTSCKKDKDVAVTSVTITAPSGGSTLTAGGASFTLTAAVLPDDATDKTLTWTSATTTVATVGEKTGVVTPVGVGTSVITAAAKNGVKGTITVTVQAATVAVASVTITDKKETLEIGEKFVFAAEVKPDNATSPTVTWTSSNAAAATVNAATGEVTAVAEGETTITAAADGKSDACKVTVTAAPTHLDVTFTVGEFVYTGGEIKPEITVKAGGATLTEGVDYDVTYSENTGAGTVTVTVTGKGAYAELSGSATFEIKPKADAVFTVMVAEGTYTYKKAEYRPAVTVKWNETTLVENVDYDAPVYSGNINVGTATVTVTGKGNFTAASTGAGNFTIEKCPIEVKADYKERTYWDDDVTLTYTTTPALYGSDELPGELTREKGAMTGAYEAVGAYQIGQGTLTGGNNYQITAFISGPLYAIYYFWGDGTSEATAYQIGKASQLAGLAGFVNDAATNSEWSDKYYKLTADINLNVAPYNEGAGWTPIGTQTNAFKGNFDGNSKKISGLFVKLPGTGSSINAGLFGVITGGTVKNLGIVGDISGIYNYGGGVAGNITNTNIINCFASVNISGTNLGASSLIGGLVGGMVGGNVTNCYSTGNVEGSSQIGGLIGDARNNAVIKNCYATGAVSSSQGSGGGLVCMILTGVTVENCAALNPSVTNTTGWATTTFGRVIGDVGGGCTVSDNVSFAGMTIQSNATGDNGTGWSAAQIRADGTLGGRFTTANGWTVENGKLPGFGAAVELPEHLK